MTRADEPPAGRRLLFLHGAGGYVEDRALAVELAAILRCRLVYPELSDQDMGLDAWAAAIRAELAGLEPRDAVVAHSFGASVLLHVLADAHPPAIGSAELLAVPDWSPDGWDVAEYAFHGPEPSTPLTLHHCRDDEVVPFAHLALNAALLPSARIREHPVGGHQFAGRAPAVARSLSAR